MDLFESFEDLGSSFCVKVTPKAASNRIVFARDEKGLYLKAYLTEVAEKGKANKALIDLLSKTFNQPKSAFKITQGLTNRVKQISLFNDNL